MAGRPAKDISGTRFGRLIAIKKVGSNPWGNARWLCRCDCGKEKEVTAIDLTRNKTSSCGCLHNEEFHKMITTAGGSYGTKEYYRAKSQKRRESKMSLDSSWTTDMESSLRDFFKSCVVCGGVDHLETDHVLPLVNGNGLAPGNAIRLCRKCNRSKGSKALSDLPHDTQRKITISAKIFQTYYERGL